MGDYFPAEVVRILDLQGIDYRQLRALAKIACPGLAQTGAWTRYQFRDLIAIKAAFELAGGHAALRAGRRLRFRRVARACEQLRARFGIADPLVQVRLELAGDVIHVHTEGVAYRASDGQVALVFDRVRGYIAGEAARGEASASAKPAPRTLRLITEALRRERDDLAQARAPSSARRARRTQTWPL